MKTAFLFPGQGSQAAGMGKDLAGAYPEAQAIYERADEALGFSLSTLCFEGPDEDLKLTKNTQPAILATSIAFWSVLEKNGKVPELAAGHSLGEYSALVAAGALEFEDALRSVRARGEAMQKACPEGEGDMAAIIGLNFESVAKLCEEEAKGEVLSPANVNSEKQVVVAGHTAAVARLMERAKKEGAKRAMSLPVSAPFHCALMQPAQETVKDVLSKITFADLKFPIIHNVTAEENSSGDKARELLVQQVTAPVKWAQIMDRLKTLDVERIVEVGPGRVLTGLMKRAHRDIEGFSINDVAGLKAYLEK